MEKNTAILIAESNQDHYQIIERNIKRAIIGEDIKRFDNGRALVEFLFTSERHPVSCVLVLDLDIEGFDGLEILRKIKSDSYLKKMPVIIFTAQQDQKKIDRCHELGCSIYISKPQEVAEFSDTVYKIGRFLLNVKVPILNSLLEN